MTAILYANPDDWQIYGLISPSISIHIECGADRLRGKPRQVQTTELKSLLICTWQPMTHLFKWHQPILFVSKNPLTGVTF